MMPASKLDQPRYWDRASRAHPHRGTIRGFCEATAELTAGDGPEARRYLRKRQLLLALLAKQEWEEYAACRYAVERGLQAPVWGYVGDMPIVHGTYLPGRHHLVWHCPFCGEKHRLHYPPPRSPEDMCACEGDTGALCVVVITTIVPLIPGIGWPRR